MAGRYLNIANAAQELCVSPGAVSQQIHTLEKWLGCRLFRRSNRGLEFTVAGETYFITVQSSLNAIRNATSAISRPDVRKAFVISVTATFAMKWLIPRLSEFREKWPDVDISVSTVELIDTFKSSDGDIGIRYGMGKPSGMKVWELVKDDLILVAQPNLVDLTDRAFSIQGLSRFPLLRDRHPKVIANYPSWDDYLKSKGLESPTKLKYREFSQQWMVIEAATNGEGIALVKSCLVIDDIMAGKLQEISLEHLELESGYYLACLPENANDRIIRSFKSWLKNSLSA